MELCEVLWFRRDSFRFKDDYYHGFAMKEVNPLYVVWVRDLLRGKESMIVFGLSMILVPYFA